MNHLITVTEEMKGRESLRILRTYSTDLLTRRSKRKEFQKAIYHTYLGLKADRPEVEDSILWTEVERGVMAAAVRATFYGQSIW